MLSGYINVLKPVGATASDIVVKLRHLLRVQKVGHLGTLDPGACGVLPIAVGRATKLFDFLTNKTKKYRAHFTFGTATDTLDSYGTVTDSVNKPISLEQLELVCATMVGQIMQVPPMYSAVYVNGIRAYDLARQGQQVDLKPRSVTVYSIDNIHLVDDNTFSMDIACSGGTYIRSLCRDIALQLGTVGYMSMLIRLESGCFDIEHALTYDEIEELGEQCIIDIMTPLQGLPKYHFADSYYIGLTNGVRPKCSIDGQHLIYCHNDFFGIGSSDNNRLVLEYNLHDKGN